MGHFKDTKDKTRIFGTKGDKRDFFSHVSFFSHIQAWMSCVGSQATTLNIGIIILLSERCLDHLF